MKKFLFVGFYFFVSVSLFSQNRIDKNLYLGTFEQNIEKEYFTNYNFIKGDKKNYDTIYFNFGFISEFNFKSPNSIAIGLYQLRSHNYDIHGSMVSCEFDKTKNLRISPKVGYYYGLLAGLLCLRTSFVYCTDFNKSALFFVPEIGISALTGISLYWGWNIPFYNNFEINYDRSLTLSVGFGYWKSWHDMKGKNRIKM